MSGTAFWQKLHQIRPKTIKSASKVKFEAFFTDYYGKKHPNMSNSRSKRWGYLQYGGSIVKHGDGSDVSFESGERMDFPSLVIKLHDTDNKGEMKRDLHTTDRSTIKDLY
jgi:hypothetical protein